MTRCSVIRSSSSTTCRISSRSIFTSSISSSSTSTCRISSRSIFTRSISSVKRSSCTFTCACTPTRKERSIKRCQSSMASTERSTIGSGRISTCACTPSSVIRSIKRSSFTNCVVFSRGALWSVVNILLKSSLTVWRSSDRYIIPFGKKKRTTGISFPIITI